MAAVRFRRSLDRRGLGVSPSTVTDDLRSTTYPFGLSFTVYTRSVTYPHLTMCARVYRRSLLFDVRNYAG